MKQAFKSISKSVAVSNNKTAVLQGCTQLKEMLNSGIFDDAKEQLQYCRDILKQQPARTKNINLTKSINKKLFWGHTIIGILGIGLVVALVL